MLIAAYLFDHPEYMYNPRSLSENWLVLDDFGAGVEA
jgi:hypothetical protein